MFNRLLALIPVLVVLAACSGNGSTGPTIGQTTPPPNQGPTVTSVTVQTSSPQIPSDGGTPATITAFVRGSNNQFLADIPVTFSATSGGLAVTDMKTTVSGTAAANLIPAADPTNRTITVTVSAGTVQGTVSVDVVGTQISISGPASLAQNSVGNFTASLLDSGGNGISGRAITLSSSRGNTLSATSVTTNASGLANFTLTGVNGGADTLRAQSLGLSGTTTVNVSVDQFTFTAPTANAEIQLGTPTPASVQWRQAGVPQVGQTITFSSTRGTLSSATATTDGQGVATVNVTANNAGSGVLSATTPTGTSTQRTVEFIASNPAAIDVQASPFNIGPQETSTITAIVRDAQGNFVKSRVVSFVLQDVTGGSLSVAAATTDSQGRAQTTYTANSATSATNGVVITGTVQGTAVSDAAQITVGRREVFISLGTGNDIEEPNIAQYRLLYAVQVTDSAGVGVPNILLTMNLTSLQYSKGALAFQGNRWTYIAPIYTCADEDVDHDGVLDPGEDFNISGRLEAGNIGTVTPQTGTSVKTDAGGSAFVYVIYPQEDALWVRAALSASTTVQGSEYVRTVTFTLPGKSDDYTNPNISPPGPVSPFGVNPCGTKD